MNKKLKAVTFSFDDGIESDIRLVELLNKYNLKCSFNLNSGLFHEESGWLYKDRFQVNRLTPPSVGLYKGHEICVHGLLHQNVANLNKDEILEEFQKDKENLEKYFNTSITGGAYAFGVYNDTTVSVLNQLGIRFCRTVQTTDSFELQKDLLRYKPSCHFLDADANEKITKFLDSTPSTPQILYIWGHSYECDGEDAWDTFENILKLLANHDDIFYGTNTEVFQYYNMF